MKKSFTLFAFLLVCSMVAIATPTSKNIPPAGSPAPLAFRENKGQVKDQFGGDRKDIQFQVNVDGASVFIGAGKISYQWNQVKTQGRASPVLKQNDPTEIKINVCRMDVTLMGYNEGAVLVKEEMMPGFDVFYAQGADGAKACSYRKITYRNIYPNIDWVVYVKDNVLKYDFVVHAGGRVSDIKLRYLGADELKIQRETLVAKTPMGTVTEQRPYSFEAASGKTVRSAFILDNDILSFSTDTYEGTLIIDPELRLEWGTYYGGMAAEWGTYGHFQHGYDVTGCSVETDFEGNVYLSGTTRSVDNIATTGSFQTSLGNQTNVFLAKFNDKGQRIWATYFGGLGGGANYFQGTTTGRGHSIACDTLGNVYMTGITWNKQGVATAGAFQQENGGTNYVSTWPDLFLAKFNSSGNRLWATYYGSHTAEEGGSVAVTKDGSKVYLTGCSDPNIGQDFQVISPNAAMPYSGTSGNTPFAGFLARFDAQGNRIWGTYIASTQIRTTVYDIAIDNQGSVFLTGNVIGDATNAALSIATPGTFQQQYGGCIFGWGGPFCPPDAFLQKWDSMGNRIWGTYYGDANPDYGYGVACDDIGNIYLTGETESTSLLASPGAYQTAQADGGFVAKFSPLGQRLWGTYYSIGHGLSFNNNRLYVVGKTTKENIATDCAHQTTLDDAGSGFMAGFNPVSGFPEYVTYYGGNGEDKVHAVCVEKGADPEKNAVYIAGFTNSSNGIATVSSHQQSLNDHDMFLAKFYLPRISYISSCFQQDSVLLMAKDTMGDNYSWNNGTVGKYLWVKTSGNYTVTYEIQPGCFAFDSFIVAIYPLPVLDTPLKSCYGTGTAIVKVDQDNQNRYTYEWYNGSGQLIKSRESITGDTLTLLAPGSYNLAITTPSDCDTLLPFTIEAFPVVVLNISNDTFVPARSRIQLWAEGAQHYRWQPETWLDDPLSDAPLSSPYDAITYRVTGYNEYGCMAMDSVRIGIMERLFIPNAFSPNSDGLNDVFRIGNYGYQQLLEFSVFNRWGECVFFTSDPDKGWDGSYKSIPADAGAYAYLIRINEKDGKQHVFKGDVTLIR